MFQKILFAILCFASLSASAQIYECVNNGRKTWTNQPCEGAKVLHEGVSSKEQRRAELADAYRRQHLKQEAQWSAQRKRELAYGRRSADSYSSNTFSYKNKQACDIARRSIRIQESSSRPDYKKLEKLRADESRYCQQ